MKLSDFLLAVLASSIAAITVSELRKVEYPWKDLPLFYPES